MRSPISLLVPILSFISFVVAVPFHASSPSSRLAKNHVSTRQFHYPRTLGDVCADIDLSLIPKGVDLGTCLCLSAFPLNLDLSLADSFVEANLKTLVENSGTRCTYPHNAVPHCSSGSPCDFACTDGFVKDRGTCACHWPNTVCNGKCGSHNACSSGLPIAPKMKRAVISSHSRRSSDGWSSSSGGLDLGGLLSGLLGSGLDLTSLVNDVIKSLGISVPISGAYQPSSLEADLSVCIGADLSGTQSLLDTTTDVINSLLSSLLGTAVNSNVGLSCSTPIDSLTISIALRLGGLSDPSLGSTLDSVLGAVAQLLNGLLGGVKIETTCTIDGSTGSTTPASPSPAHSPPSPSTSVGIPPSTSPAGRGLGELLSLDQLLNQVEGILGGLGLSLDNYSLDTGVDPIVWVSVGLSDSLSSVDGLATDVLALVDKILDTLLAVDVDVQLDLNSTPPPISQGESIVVNIDLSALLSDVTLSDKDVLLDSVSSAVSEVLASLLNTHVTAIADGGPGCGCGGPKMTSANGK